jgi:5-oxopent-3-ene-1,2,5-tricarboxylate decarboxylase/2-hydroxyhepta-2,4-diene-1,7-dioate isomerase
MVLRNGVLVAADGRTAGPADAVHLPPCTPSKIICVHLNYQNRIDELKTEGPPAPNYFLKPPSSLNSHKGVVVRPRGTRFLNYEGEVAIVIGTTARNIRVADALDYVAGYSLANDFAIHDFRHADRGSMLRVKGQDGFLPIGPALVTRDEWTPDGGYTVTTYVNGDVVQRGDQDDIIWDYRYQLADLSRLITLEPGDVVLTGTPANSRPMQPGDTVEVEIGGLPRLTNTVVDWDVDLSGPGEQIQVSANTLHVALAIPEAEAEQRVREGRLEP